MRHFKETFIAVCSTPSSSFETVVPLAADVLKLYLTKQKCKHKSQEKSICKYHLSEESLNTVYFF